MMQYESAIAGIPKVAKVSIKSLLGTLYMIPTMNGAHND